MDLSNVPVLLLDIIRIMMLFSIPAALICLFRAGIKIAQEHSVANLFTGGASNQIFWAVLFITFPQLLNWFAQYGFQTQLPNAAGIQTPWLNTFPAMVNDFVQNLVIGYLTTAFAAFFLLRAIFQSLAQESPVLSLMGLLFMLSISSTYSLLVTWNTQGNYALYDVLANGWNYTATRLCPVAACYGVIRSIYTIVQGKSPYIPIGTTVALLCVPSLWALFSGMDS